MCELFRRVIARVLVVLLACAASGMSVAAQARPTITFDNRSGADAVVRLAGPTAGMVEVPDAGTRTVTVRGGTYQIFVRYGQPGKYRYTRGAPFTVAESANGVEEVTITLHTVVNGNYGSSPSNEAEFSGGKR